MEATLKNILAQSYACYRDKHGVSVDQHHAAMAIMQCCENELGYEEWLCERDGHIEQQAHACRHRSCPRCQHAYNQQWLDKTRARLLPCTHHHVVFTLPHELNELWQYNRQWSADHLFKAAAETLRELLRDERYLGAEVGILAALHTWGRTASFHPHVHMLVTGGGVSGEDWRELKKPFLLPVGVLKAKFRGKWLNWLNVAYAKGDLRLPRHWQDRDWRRVLARVARKGWNVCIQGPYDHGSGVTNYLSRYLRGGPIKDARLIRYDDEQVSFRYRDHRDGKDKSITLKTEEFIRRLLWHVPVKGQHNLRYYGLYVPGARDKRDCVREQLGRPRGEEVILPPKATRVCPDCGAALLHYRSTRRKKSYIKSPSPAAHEVGLVQQGVRADRPGHGWSPPGGLWKKFCVVPRRHN